MNILSVLSRNTRVRALTIQILNLTKLEEKLSMRQKPKTTTANTCTCRIQSSHGNRKMSNHCRDDHIKLRNPEPWVFLHRALDPTRSLRKALSPKPEALNT